MPAARGLDVAIVHHLPSAGGAPRVLAEYLRASPQHRFTVYTRWPQPLPEEELITLPEDVTMRRFPLPEPGSRLARLRALRALPQRGRELAATIDAAGHDVVFAHASLLVQSHEVLPHLTTPSLAYAPEPLRTAHEETVAFGGHGGGLRQRLVGLGLDPYERLRAHIDSVNIRAADRIVTHSRFTAQSLRRAYGVEADVVPLGVRADEFTPDRSVPRERSVLSVGALHPLKGHQDVVSAVATLPAGRRPRVVVVGDRGRLEDPLRAHAAALDVELELLQGIPFAELLDRYRRAGVIVAAMIREPFGLVPLEAMATGSPVVAVAEGGLAETVRDAETGVLSPRAPKVLGANIARVLDDPDLAARLGRAGRHATETEWTWRRTADGYDALLDELAAPRHRC